MASPVELILGPARSGKAGRALDAYLAARQDAGPERCLMLVPTGERRRLTERRLLRGEGRGVLMLPRVLTLPDLAERLLAGAGATVRRIAPLARRQVIRSCLAALGEKEAKALGTVCDAPGLVDALDNLFRELKAARVEPDAFGRALPERMRTPTHRLLVLLYAAYQKALQTHDVYDDAGRFWHAAALAREGRLGPFGNLALVVVDGFQAFAPAQLEMLEALADAAERTLITLTCEPDRPHVFGVTGRTREALRERFGGRLEEVTADATDGALPADLDAVRRHLFRMDEEAPRVEPTGAVRLVRAAGRTREVETVARQVGDLIRSGAGRPGSIGVLARSMEVYGPLVREIFGRHGIPFHGPGPHLGDVPVVRAAMALVRLPAERYAFRALARVLRSDYVRPKAFGAGPGAARAAVRLAREANVWEGRDRYGAALDRLERQIDRAVEAGGDPDEPSVTPEHAEATREAIARARDLLKALFAATDLPAKGTRSAFVEAVRTLIDAAGLRQAAADHPDPAIQARDLRALAALDDLLGELAAVDLLAPDEVTLDAFVAELSRALVTEGGAADGTDGAPVAVRSAHDARALGFDHVFLLGLCERLFPRKGRSHPFFTDAERRDLRERGVDLPDAGHQADDEMFLFYMAATRAARTLTLCYPTLDGEGRPALPSHYLEAVTGLFARPDGSHDLPTEDVGARDLDLPPEAPRTPERLLAAAMHRLWGPGATPDIDAHLAVLEALRTGPAPEATEAALAGLAAEWEREHGEAFGPFDGMLTGDDLVQDLRKRLPKRTMMSAARLERYGRCPFAYLAAELLGLEPAEEPSRELGPLDLGLIVHRVLERYHAAAPDGGEPEAAADHARLEAAGDAVFAALEGGGQVGSPALWKAERERIRRDLHRLIDWQHRQTWSAGWRTAHVEVAFGDARRATPPSTAEPLVIETAHGPLRLRGRIDRVDLGPEGKLRVVDYKSGASAPSHGAMKAGISFQLPVYAMAALKLFGPDGAPGDVEAFFLPVRDPSRTGRLYKKNLLPTLDLAETYADRFLGGMRDGAFPVYPRTETSCKHCDFAAICRYAEWRVRRKWTAHPIEALRDLSDEARPDTGGEDAA